MQCECLSGDVRSPIGDAETSSNGNVRHRGLLRTGNTKQRKRRVTAELDWTSTIGLGLGLEMSSNGKLASSTSTAVLFTIVIYCRSIQYNSTFPMFDISSLWQLLATFPKLDVSRLNTNRRSGWICRFARMHWYTWSLIYLVTDHQLKYRQRRTTWRRRGHPEVNFSFIHVYFDQRPTRPAPIIMHFPTGVWAAMNAIKQTWLV
jgi:hypothetical protein